jgi:hypothetical protein
MDLHIYIFLRLYIFFTQIGTPNNNAYQIIHSRIAMYKYLKPYAHSGEIRTGDLHFWRRGQCHRAMKIFSNLVNHPWYIDALTLNRMPWRRGIVVIASASRTEDPGFESRQGVRFSGLYTFQCCCRNLICIVIVWIWKKINSSELSFVHTNRQKTDPFFCIRPIFFIRLIFLVQCYGKKLDGQIGSFLTFRPIVFP